MPLALLLGLLLLLPTAAHAQEGSAVLAVAIDALDEGDAGRALELARMARALEPAVAPEALVVMGRALMRLERPAVAHRLFRLALEGAAPRTRAAALAGLTRANLRVGLLRLDVHPAGAVLEIDGERVEWERGQRIVLTTIGHHRVVARAPGHRPREANVYARPEVVTDVHLVLSTGDEERTESVHGPPAEAPVARWQSGNLLQSAIGLAGVGASATWAADAARRGTPGAAIEGAYAHYELGVSLGLTLGSQAHMVLWDATGGRTSLVLDFGAVILLSGAAMATSMFTGGTTAPDLRLLSGLFAGGAVSAFGNMALDRRGGSVALSLVLTSVGLAATQLPIALDALSTQPVGQTALERYRASLPAGADACARVMAGDTQAGAFDGQMGTLETSCSRRDGLAAASEVALGVTLGSAALGMGTALVMFATGDEGDGLDFAISAGPSSVRATGQF